MGFSLAVLTALAILSPETPALQFGEVHLATGVRLHYAEQGDPRGHPVILLHGLSDSWFSYSRVLPLIDRKYHVYALDLRGHGDSDRPDTGYAMDELAADVLAFMNDKQLARVTVVGHSMGSFVAQRLAGAAPERIARLVLVGSAAVPGRVASMTELDAAIQALDNPVPESFVREFQLSTVYGGVPEDFIAHVVAESLRLPLQVWRGSMRGLLAAEPPASLATSRIPTLVIWGDRDSVFPREQQDALVSAIGTADLLVYTETGHAPHWERPREFARDLHAFMERTTSY